MDRGRRARGCWDRGALSSGHRPPEALHCWRAFARSHRRAELILVQMGLGDAAAVVGPAIGVEVIVAQEFVSDAVELIGAGFRDDVEHATARASELSRVSGRL